MSYVARHPGAFACRKCTHADGCTELAKPDPQIPNQLSARESEVLALLAERLPNKQISARLAINAATVRTHLMRIYKKVNVYCRTEAGAKFLRAGTKNTGR